MRLFDVLGPVMIGPSSSHTAGAARIGRTATSGGRLAVQIGPDEWQLLAPLSEGDAIVELFGRLQTPHSLVDIGHRE